MSRCFPFPPPGYEKRARSDDVELLAKEKHKEKKHKKEKKDKEKREGKEKKDKERSRDKHKEKNERKEKHKHKKKEKDKEKHSTPDDQQTVKGGNDGPNEEKPGESSFRAVHHMETKLTEALDKRIKNEARPADNQVFRESVARVQGTGRTENVFNAPDQRRAMGHMETTPTEELVKRIKNEARPAENPVFRETCAPVQRTESMFNASDQRRAVGHMEAKLEEELGQRIKNEARPAENQVSRETTAPVQRRIESLFSAPDRRRVDSLGKAVEKENEKGTAQKEKKEGDNRRPERCEDSVGRTAESKIQNINGTNKCAGQKGVEGKEKNKDKKSKDGDDKRGDRHKDKNREEKRSEKKDKKRDKEKKKEKDKVKVRSEDRHKEQDKLKDTQKEHMNRVNIKAHLPPKNVINNDKSIASEGNLKKRKDFETNGIVYESDLRPTKLPRAASSFQLPLENGKKFESSHISIRCSSERQEGCSETLGKTNNRKGEINKEHKVNGKIEVQPSPDVPTSAVPSEPLVNCEASNRPPHPDSIRLNQLLMIPKMEEWSDFDDQEWLFSSSSLHSNPTAADVATEAPQVWREALRIESADVLALPYVIPF